MKKTSIEVQGFEEHSQRTKIMSHRVTERSILGKDVSPVSNGQVTNQMTVVVSEVTSEKGSMASREGTKLNPVSPDFEEVLRDLDESINAFPGTLNADSNISNHREEKGEEMTLLEVPVLQAKNKLILEDRLHESGGIQKEIISVGRFQVGWTAGDGEKKGKKSGGGRNKDKTHARNKSPSKGDVINLNTLDSIPDKRSGQKKGTWSRIMLRPNSTSEMDCMVEEIGPKRKDNKLTDVEVVPHAKKLKKAESFVVQSNVAINHSGSAEVVEQPHRVQ